MTELHVGGLLLDLALLFTLTYLLAGLLERARITGLIMGVTAFILLAWLSYRWLIVLLARWLPRRPRNLMLLSMIILFGFGGLSGYTGLGMKI